jgi:peptidoglycan hydrolase-like protein with peptidoglycan-binding domain
MARALKIYMRGKGVRTLQTILKQMGYPMEDQPAIFGVSTRDGVKDFQKRKGLKPTGMVDDELFRLMQESVGFQAETTVKPEKPVGLVSPAETSRMDALVSLLISKGVITQEELDAAMRPAPAKASQTPLI